MYITKRKATSVLLTSFLILAMCIGFFAVSPIKAHAAISDVIIGDESVTNPAVNDSGNNWIWTAATNTLTLSGNITGVNGIFIVCAGTDSINLVLTANASVSSTTAAAIQVNGGNLVISAGAYTLTAQGNADSSGISVSGTTTINSGIVIATGGPGASSTGLYSYGGLTINGSATLTASGKSQGISTDAGTIVNTSGTVTVGTIYSDGNIDGPLLVNGGTVNVAGILSGTLTVTGGIVTIGTFTGTPNINGGTVSIGGMSITGINPDIVTTTGGTVVTITGTSFNGATAVTFGGVPATDVVVLGGGTTITCTTPAHVAASVLVVVTAPSKVASLPGRFTFVDDSAPTPDAPLITSPNSATVAAGGTFTVTSLGFPAPTFSLNGSEPSGVSISSDGILSVASTVAAGIYSFNIAADNDEGTSTQPFTLTVQGAPPTTYRLTLNGALLGDYAAGESVPITAPPQYPGWIFYTWFSENGGTFDDEFSENTFFNMPANDVNIRVGIVPDPSVTLYFDGITDFHMTVSVGDTFILTPKNSDPGVPVDTNLKEEGWEWSDNVVASFNSPATFTAVRAGQGFISYTASYGQAKTIFITVLERGSGTTPPNGGGSSAGSPRTADDTPLGLWITLALISGAALTTFIIRRRLARN